MVPAEPLKGFDGEGEPTPQEVLEVTAKNFALYIEVVDRLHTLQAWAKRQFEAP